MKLFTRNLCITMLLAVLHYTAVAQVTAGFTAVPSSGCAPLLVAFTNTTTPSAATTYVWNLDNGPGTTSVTLTDPGTSYTAPGTYTVTLTATNGSSSSTTTQVITVYPSPTVSFVASDTSICPGSSVTFTSTTVGGVPGAVTTEWAFGDGLSGAGSPVSHTYTAPGVYNVTLTATNAAGCVASYTRSLYIHVLTPPTPAFSASATHFCHPPATVSFTSSVAGTGPFSYIWNFGDGSAPGTGPSPTHTYGGTGTYTVHLTVIDANGCQDSITIPSYITVTNLTGSFTAPDTACVNSIVTFSSTSGSGVSVSWNYGDGHTGTGPIGYNVYSVPGAHTVTMVISDGYCTDTITRSIVILPAATASFTITPAEPCPAPITASFAGTVPAGSTVRWLYGDGGTGTGASSTHSFGADGTYVVSMIVTNASGCIDTIQQSYTIHDLFFDISHLIDTVGCAPLTVNFRTNVLTLIPGPTATYPYPVSSYTWNFGDGSAAGSGPTPSHTYTSPGVYHVTVSIITANGCTASATTTVIVGSPPTITFSATPRHECYHDNLVTFTATIISGPVDNYVWEFGDGTGITTSSGTVTHHFVLPGVFSVTVWPSYHGCPGDSVVMTDYITIDSPMSIIWDSVLCSPVNTVMFRDSSMGDNTHVWLFGDGDTSTAPDPSHTYPSPIVYTATLATYNIRSGCRDTAITSIDLTRPVVTFTTPDTAVCRDTFLLFTSTVTGGIASYYIWSAGGRSADYTSPTFLDTFHTTGIYTIQLVIIDQNGCMDTSKRNNYVLIAKPVANFTVAPAAGCWPFTTTFTDHSTDVAGTTYASFAWTFGDGSGLTVASPSVSHTFTTAGTFTTQEIVTDNVGCKDTVSLPSVTVYRPHAAFTVTTVHPCESQNINFTNGSTGATTYLWSFGDGSTSTLASPVHNYPDTGYYTVKLIVLDTHGCSDTANMINYIHVTKPIASFHMDDSVSICPPLTVHFTNTSTGGVLNNWTMGDGSGSTLTNPSDLYIVTGVDTVKLIVTNTYGCKDTAEGMVKIFGYAGAFTYSVDSGCAPLTVFFDAHITNVPSIVWDFSDGTTSSASLVDTISHTYTIPGSYLPKLILSNNTGCKNSSTAIDTIKVDGITPGFTTIPNPVCIGDSIHLSDTSHSFWSTIVGRVWTFNGSTSNLASPSVTYSATGTYPVSLVVTDGWGCVASALENIVVHPLPVITVGPDTIICVGDAATLIGYGGVSYTWSGAGVLSCTACNPSFASPTVITQYTVTGTDAFGCQNWDTTSVFLKTQTIARAWGDTQICYGQVVPLYDSGGTKYTWVPNEGLNNANIADPMASPPNSITYMAIAKLASCNPDTNYVTVIVHPLPTVDAGPDQNLLAGSSAQLKATGTLISTYLWTPENTLSCDTCYNPVASMSVNTTYYVKVSTIFGCTADDSVNIRLFCDNSQLFIPNTFTPNNDGKNDRFYPRGQGVSIVKSFRIYNRWGELLFERSDIKLNDESNAWDGTYNGSTPRPDVYVWVIDAVCETGQPLFLKGDVTIIR